LVVWFPKLIQPATRRVQTKIPTSNKVLAFRIEPPGI
jgi:hypothetical protein